MELIQIIGILIFIAGAAGILLTWKAPSIGMFWLQCKERKTHAYVAYAAIAIAGIIAVALFMGVPAQEVQVITPTPAATVIPTVPVASNGEPRAVVEEKLNHAIADMSRDETIAASNMNTANSITEQTVMKSWFRSTKSEFIRLLADYDAVYTYCNLDKEFYPVNSDTWRALDSSGNLASVKKIDVQIDYNSLVDNFNAYYGEYLGYEGHI